MAGVEPLLAPRPSSEGSSINAEEEESLLTGRRNPRTNTRSRWTSWREIGLFTWAFVVTVIVIVLAVVYQHERSAHPRSGGWGRDGKPKGKRNMIFMVSDGMGPTSLTMTRSYMQFTEGLPIDDILVLDQHIIGTSRTRSSNSLVTDSAAGATAFSCGLKSYNGAISVLPNHDPCGTVMEAAKKAGYMTGLVVTTRVTDATPACFASHVNLRQYEDQIASQEIGEHPLGHVVDLIMGGGRCHFLSNTTAGSCRADEKDIISLAKQKGYSYVDDRKGFDGLKLGSAVELPLLALFADGDIPYEIDRRNENNFYPSLDEMARTALNALSEATRNSDKGFFIMIEGSRIDHAGHGNDPAAQVHEVLAYDKAFASVLKFLEDEETEGVLVGTSDHETGGLAAARQLHAAYPDYLWHPAVLANASHSAERSSHILHAYVDDNPSISKSDLSSYITSTFLPDNLGIFDASSSEVSDLVNTALGSDDDDAEHPILPASYTLADMISRRAQIGWSTHGHSGVDVNIYASDPNHAPQLIGNHENTEVGEFIAKYLDLDLGPISKELQQKGLEWGENMNKDASPTDTMESSESKERVSWMGALPKEGARLDGNDGYHGEFRKRDLGCGHVH
ncbi:MAG: vacuolar alkaline phosphatase [Cirrosporium novae-zelandiae]|nr:MAG: vacuolar alkaline phosphatase [Cirrosporium novae-zelandiae]